jgi:hypothetical protein
VVAKKKKGETFGEIALTGKDQRTATIRAVTIVEVLRLHKVDYDHFVRDIQLAERRDHTTTCCENADSLTGTAHVMFICTD